jgi:hypothetical protein
LIINHLLKNLHQADNIEINPAFCLKDSVLTSEHNVVIFSPFTCETLLCERKALSLLVDLAQKKNNPSKVKISQHETQWINDIIVKLISMRIILLKE